MKIGICRQSYPEKRCIINRVNNNSYVDLSQYNIYCLLSKFEKKITKKSFCNNDYKNININTKKVDGYHYFNYIGIMKAPWIVTFETFIPRIKDVSSIHHLKDENIKLKKTKSLNYGIRKLANYNCKKIIALSKCNYKMQKEILNLYPEYKEIIGNKLIQINPPQKLLINNFNSKNVGLDKITFTFVGSDFVRKGGLEILKAFLEVTRETDFNLELILITDFTKRYNYAFKEFQDENQYVENLVKEIEGKEWIRHYNKISNEEVIKIMKETHVGLLPTWGDTYGFSVLEFQSCGCPVITTNVRALPEINNDECGWVINLNTNKFGELAIESKEEKDKIREIIVKDLKDIIRKIMNDKNIIKYKSNLSIDRIKRDHDLKDYERKLDKIYIESFSE